MKPTRCVNDTHGGPLCWRSRLPGLPAILCIALVAPRESKMRRRRCADEESVSPHITPTRARFKREGNRTIFDLEAVRSRTFARQDISLLEREDQVVWEEWDRNDVILQQAAAMLSTRRQHSCEECSSIGKARRMSARPAAIRGHPNIIIPSTRGSDF